MKSHILDICRKTKRVGNKQLMLFIQIMRRHMVNAGIEQDVLEQALKQAIIEFRANQTYTEDCTEILKSTSFVQQGREKRGIDSIGRILIEYCFFKIPKTKLVWPENSEEDTQSRISYTEGIIPRPLMRYFLISVRGTVMQLDQFRAPSVLFGEENAVHEKRKAYVDDLIEQYKENETHISNINWNSVYADDRFQKVALEMIGDVRRKLEQFGLERYLRILENLQQRDPEKNSVNSMQRPFVYEDVKQIDEALWAAEEALAQIIE